MIFFSILYSCGRRNAVNRFLDFNCENETNLLAFTKHLHDLCVVWFLIFKLCTEKTMEYLCFVHVARCYVWWNKCRKQKKKCWQMCVSQEFISKLMSRPRRMYKKKRWILTNWSVLEIDQRILFGKLLFCLYSPMWLSWSECVAESGQLNHFSEF